MAGNSVIGALRIVLGLDSASLETGLKKAQGSLNSFANSAKITGAVIGGALAGAIAGIGVSIKGAIDEAAKLSRLAESVGVPVEELSRLRLAAQLSGVELETLAKSFGILSKNMVSAAAGVGEIDVKGSKAAKAFAALGIAVKDSEGNLKSSNAVMLEIAEKFSGMENGAGKTALAMMIFGKAGAALIPMLNKGSGALKEMMDEADALGLTISTRTGKAAVEFGNTLLRMGVIKDGIINKITEHMLPAFNELAKAMLEARKNSGLMSEAAGLIKSALEFVVTEAAVLIVALRRLSVEWSAFWAALKSFGLNEKLMEEFRQAGAETDKQLAAIRNKFSAMFNATGADAEKFGKTVGPKIYAPIIAGAEKAKNALDSFLASQAKQLAAHEAEALTIGMLVGAREKLKIQLEGAAIAQANNIVMTDKQRVALEAAALAAGNMALKLAGLKLTEELLLPWEEFNKKLDLNRQLFERGELSVENYGRANKRVAEQAAATWDMAGASIAGSFATIAGSFGESNSAMAIAAKAFAIVNAVISTYTGMAKALELPFPANLAAVAVVAAKGFAFVAAIQSQAVPKFAAGADFIVGGASGIDRNRVTMDLTRGERVRVDPAGSHEATRQRGESRTLTVRGFSTREFFMGDQVRDLCENISQHVRDGGRLEVSPA